MKIGFVGLGIMGRPMALNILKGGFDLTVWARRAESMAPLLAAGAKGAASALTSAAPGPVTVPERSSHSNTRGSTPGFADRGLQLKAIMVSGGTAARRRIRTEPGR